MSRKSTHSNVAHAMSSLEQGQGMQQRLVHDVIGFEKLAARLKSVAGINLPTNEKNLSLLSGRLGPVLRRHGLTTYSEYSRLLSENEDPALMSEFISALTTNTTEFFRESKHYDVLDQLVKEGIESKFFNQGRELRVWCAAASTGQEPYSILMRLLETLPNAGFWDLRFLATDIDREVLERSAEAVYSEAEMRNIPAHLRQKYFESFVGPGQPKSYRVLESYRSKIRFASLNLLQPFPFQHKFDVIFCRNVLIYFEASMAQEVVRRMAESLRPGGYLFLGHSETGAGRTTLLKSIAPSVYKRV